MRPISYLQTDIRWKNLDYSAPGEKTTIGASGCGPSCMAMVIATLKDETITPKETCQWALKHGYKAPNQGTYYSYFVPAGVAYGITLKRINLANIYKSNGAVAKKAHQKAIEALKKGNWVIACMGKGNWTSSGHYILAYELKGNKVLINDPNSTKAERTCADVTLWQSQVKYYWIIEVSTEEKEEDEDEMIRYQRLSDIPNEYGFRDIINTLMDAKIINGDGSDPNGNNDVIDLSHDQVRSFVMSYRGGAFDRKLIAMGMPPAVEN
ncbi:MAG: C39 family peptidase [Anaerovoracaceae bacterium]